jgi:hypothetical protein
VVFVLCRVNVGVGVKVGVGVGVGDMLSPAKTGNLIFEFAENENVKKLFVGRYEIPSG